MLSKKTSMVTMVTDEFLENCIILQKSVATIGFIWIFWFQKCILLYILAQVFLVMRSIRSHISLFRLGFTPTLTYIQGHVIQDGRQIHFSKSNLGLKLPVTQPIFGQIQSFLFCFVAGDQFSTLDGKAIPTMVPCVFWLQRNDPPILLFTTMENCIVAIFNWEWWENWSKLSVPPLISLQWHINAFRKVLLRAAHSVIVK